MPSYDRQLRRGEMLFTKGRLDDALKVFAAILKADPMNTHALNDAALVLMEMDEPERAVTLLERALTADPANEAAFFNLLDHHRRREEVAALVHAFRRFARGVRDSPEKTAYRDALAPVLDEMDENDAARTAPAAAGALHVTGMAGSGVAFLASVAEACAAPAGLSVATSTLGVDGIAHLERLVDGGRRVAVVVRDPVATIAAWNADAARPEARVSDEDAPGYPDVAWASDDHFARQAQLWQMHAATVWAWRDAARVFTYEQVVRAPETAAAEIAAWLGVEPPSALPVPERAAADGPDTEAIRAAVMRYAPLRKVFGYAEAPRLLTPVAAGDGMDERALPGLAS